MQISIVLSIKEFLKYWSHIPKKKLKGRISPMFPCTVGIFQITHSKDVCRHVLES